MRDAIIVLGMHRSGTSLVSGILKLTGLDLGKNLWNPDHANVKGYFENSQIGIFNDRLFEMMHTNWHDTLLLPDQWWLDDKILGQMDRFGEIIRDEFDTTSLLLFKDPRISVLLPFYMKAFDKLKIKPYFIINFRDPYEVAASLKKRNNLSLSKSLILWMDHTLKAELYTRDQPRIFIQYDQVLANPLLFLKKIFSHFNLEYKIPPAHSKRINEFVSKELKHQSGQNIPENYKIPAEVKRLYDLIRTLKGKDSNSSFKEKFDKIGADFYSEYRLYHGVDDGFEALLQIETPSGERKTSTRSIHTGHNKIEFGIDAEVTRIILNPCNQKTGMILHKTVITDDKNIQSEIQPHYSNAEWSDPDGTLVFESETSEITYILESPKILTKIFFDLTYIVNACAVYRFGIQERNHFIQGLSDKNLESQEQINKDRQEIDTLNNLIRSRLNEIDELKAYNSKKEEEYHQVISFCRKEIDNMSILIAKNEEAFRLVIESKQMEIESLSATNTRQELTYNESLKSGQREIERLTLQIGKNESQSNLMLEAKQNEVIQLSSEIQRIREEMKHVVDIKQQELSRIYEQLRKQESEYSNTIDGLNRKMDDTKSTYEREMAYTQKLLKGKENELSVTLNSYTWKTGKLILAPARFFLNKRRGG